MLFTRMTVEACWRLGSPEQPLMGWWGRLSVHDSSFFLYMDPLEGFSFLVVTRHTAIDTLIPCTIQKFLSWLRLCAAALWMLSAQRLWFSKNCCISCQRVSIRCKRLWLLIQTDSSSTASAKTEMFIKYLDQYLHWKVL